MRWVYWTLDSLPAPVYGGGRSALTLGQSAQHMKKFRVIAVVVAFAGLLYCGWALYRMGAAGMLDPNWPRPFPYPDTLLDQYHTWLDARYPASAGTLKLHGEIFRVRLTLWAICAAFTAVLVFAVLPALRRLKSPALLFCESLEL